MDLFETLKTKTDKRQTPIVFDMVVAVAANVDEPNSWDFACDLDEYAILAFKLALPESCPMALNEHGNLIPVEGKVTDLDAVFDEIHNTSVIDFVDSMFTEQDTPGLYAIRGTIWWTVYDGEGDTHIDVLEKTKLYELDAKTFSAVLGPVPERLINRK